MATIGSFSYYKNLAINTIENGQQSVQTFGDVSSPSYFKKVGNYIYPLSTSWYIGSANTSALFNQASTTELCLVGDSCRTTWPAGGTGSIAQLGQIGDVSTSSPMTYGLMLRYNTSNSKWESVATSTLGITGAMTYPGAGIALSTGSAWDTSITNSSANWNTAYGWGNHASAGYYAAANFNNDWDVRMTATTSLPKITALAGLSITKSQISDLGTLFTQTIASTTFVDRAAWTSIDNYPTGCTNQFVRTIGDTLTCATVGAADVSLANLTATDTTLTFSGTYTGATARTIGLNLANANSWTALQTFANATTTLLSATYASSTTGFFGALTVSGNTYLASTSIGDGTNYTKIDADGDFFTVGTADYLVAANKYAFRYSADEDYGLYFDGTNARYEFRDSTAAPTAWISALGTTASYIKFNTGIGTTTPASLLNIASTDPYFIITDTNAGVNLQHWFLHSASGAFTIGTVSDSLATITTYLTITSAGGVDLSGATSLKIPNAATALGSATGQISIDTTSGQLVIINGLGNTNGTTTIPAYFYASFSYATSTAWTGTTTIYLGPAFIAETWKQVKCFTDAGTVNVSFWDGTNRMDLFNASTTVGTVSLVTNNAFTAGEKRQVDIGTPATSPTKIGCTISKQYDRD